MTQPRAQLKRAYLDVDFLNQPKIRALARVYGRIAQLCIIDIYLAMSKATRALIDKDAILAIVEDFDISEPEQFLAYCYAKGLVEIEGSLYTNSIVVRDQEQYAKKLKIKPDESEDSGNILPTVPDSPGNNPTIPGNETGLPDSDNESLDLKKNGDALTLPPNFETPEIRKALNDWSTKQLATTRKPFDQIQLDALILKFRTPEALLAALVHSCSLSTTRNVYPPPQPRAQSSPAKPERSGKLKEWVPPWEKKTGTK